MKAPAVPMDYMRNHGSMPVFLPVMAALLLSLLSGSLVGCRRNVEQVPEAPKGVEKTLERGPMSLALRTSADSITTAETLTLTLSVTLEDGYSVAFPEYPAPATPEAPAPDAAPAIVPPEFTSTGFEDAAPVLGDDGKVTRSRTYRLEPFLEGNYTIPPLSVSYWKEVEGEDKKSTVDTEAVTIAVTSVLTANEPPAVKDIVGPVAVQDPIPWGRYTVLLLVLAAAAGVFYWYKWVRVVPGPPPPPPVPPHVRALEALEAIEREKLVEKGLYKDYYIRVSDVLRHYMEEEFQLRAPERTTEEFLAELQHNAVLGLQEQLLLRAFLRHCDLVKFAKAEPSSEEIRETFQTCEKFIIDSEAAHRAAKKAAAQAATAVEA